MMFDVEVFKRDGAVVLRGVFTDWIKRLRESFEQNLAQPSQFAIENVGSSEGVGVSKTTAVWQRIAAFIRIRFAARLARP